MPGPEFAEALARRLLTSASAGADEWHQDSHYRTLGHALYTYPAMMVPTLQRQILEDVTELQGSCTVFDPFVGSGTILTEALLAGHAFRGVDINPLAVLITKAKSDVFDADAIRSASDRAISWARGSRQAKVVAFPGSGRWFQPEVLQRLSRLKDAIGCENDARTRRFLWVCLAETTRLTSNSRTSTFKLHRRSPFDISVRTPDVCGVFETIVRRNHSALTAQWRLLQERGHLKSDGTYRHAVRVLLADTVSRPWGRWRSADILMTSPPYGDNVSTVTYGQASYLPLQFIPTEDIDEGANWEYLRSTHEIDTRSLGGSRVNALKRVEKTRARSAALDVTLCRLLREQPRDRAVRVATFCADLDGALRAMLRAVRSNAPLVITMGDRSVGGQRVPMAAITSQLLAASGAEIIAEIERKIPRHRKRMPNRNSIASTMSSELLIVAAAKAHSPQ